MTMRLDLRTHQQWDGTLSRLAMSPTPFGCADCETWFQFAWQLVHHDCEARNAR